MDWDSRDYDVFRGDVEKRENKKSLARYPATSQAAWGSTVAQVVEVNNVFKPLEHWCKADNEIKTWTESVALSRTRGNTKGVYVILGNRQPKNESLRNPQVLINLPFTSTTFQHIINDFLVNISIIRTLNRPAAVFTRTHFKHVKSMNPLISYNLRDCTEPSTDIGMSVTTDPSASLTFVIIYGCLPKVGTSESDSDQFIERLSHCGSSYLHPLLLTGLFAEIQRRKHVSIVRKSIVALEEYVINLGDNTLGEGHDKENAAQDGVDHWLEVSHYKVKLERWKMQLEKMITAVDELDEVYYGKDLAGKVRVETMFNESRRIRERLEDIIRDYDDMISKCQRVIDGTSLANGTAWNHLARQDNTQMKSIALLTMVFLPANFVATFFAMPLLKWDADTANGEHVYNPRAKYYWIVSLPLTFVVVVLWYCLAVRAKISRRKVDAHIV